ncbi:DNA polymerase IV [Catenovulum adriaticum]|uniref:DNA polymerase IV n=1 Tax=Catenovulum adriaticum TaxID=2984846 RepID=A0ABY7AHY4_9ALTE|nr:DNA polymerase IV [Catenovulum sp. TS8]WAJ69069.1 DNA polymerase IV [Catenovulum sp. TS8]
MTQKSRKIIHVDMDCFFAAVEMRENPKLKQVPLAVGGSRDRRGVISTCNYIARQYGIHSAMATAHAFKLCPNLVLVPGNMALYREVSAQVRNIFLRYSEIIEPLSLDEAYIDVTDSAYFKGSATLIAQAIRHDIEKETQLTASAGVAPNKFLAKIASEENKPNGLYVITPQNVSEFVRELDLKKIHGVGKATLKKLNQLGLYTAADIRNFDQSRLIKHFGRFATHLRERCQGVDDRTVNTHRIRKSIGVERTFAKDLTQISQSRGAIKKLFDDLVGRIKAADKQNQIKKLSVKLKFDDFQLTSLESSQFNHINLLTLENFEYLLSTAWQRSQGRSVRLIGLSVGLNEVTDKDIHIGMHQQLRFKF